MGRTMVDGSENLPTIRGWLENWLGFQLPTIPMPKTLKNLDKAVSTVVLATAANAKVRIDGSTGKIKAANQITVDDMFRTAEEKRKFENRASTTKAAIEDLKNDPSPADAPTEIEEDWLNTFGRLAEEKSSEELQNLFGKILAGEIRKPGSFSLRTLQFIANLSRADAHGIAETLPYVIDKSFLPFVDEGFQKLDVPHRIVMEELGILTGAAGPMGGLAVEINVPPGDTRFIQASGYGIKVTNQSTVNLKSELGGQAVSSVARELFSIAQHADTDLEYLVYLGKNLARPWGILEGDPARSQQCSVDLIKLTSSLPDGRFTYVVAQQIVIFEPVINVGMK